jgi:hypothetical protein
MFDTILEFVIGRNVIRALTVMFAEFDSQA